MNQTTPKTKTKPSTREETSKGSFKERYAECIKNLKIVPTVSIKGKAYSTVAERHRHLKKYFPESKIDEALLFHDTERVIIKTTLLFPVELIYLLFIRRIKIALELN